MVKYQTISAFFCCIVDCSFIADVMISKFKSYDSEFTKVDVILEKSNAIDVQTSTIKANQQEIKSRNSECHKLV